MKIYLDNCCLNRPFEDQASLRVRLESEAVNHRHGDYVLIQESGVIMSGRLQIAECPSCGSGRIERTVRDVVRRHEGQEYVVPAVALHECPDCGEKVYDREAMLKIEAYSPAYNKEKAKSSAKGRRRSAAAGKLVRKKSAA